MAPHSSTLAWKIPWKGEPGRLQSMGSLFSLAIDSSFTGEAGGGGMGGLDCFLCFFESFSK